MCDVGSGDGDTQFCMMRGGAGHVLLTHDSCMKSGLILQGEQRDASELLLQQACHKQTV